MRCKGISRDALVTASARDGRMRGVPVLRSAVHNVRGPRMRLRRGVCTLRSRRGRAPPAPLALRSQRCPSSRHRSCVTRTPNPKGVSASNRGSESRHAAILPVRFIPSIVTSPGDRIHFTGLNTAPCAKAGPVLPWGHSSRSNRIPGIPDPMARRSPASRSFPVPGSMSIR